MCKLRSITILNKNKMNKSYENIVEVRIVIFSRNVRLL